MLRVGSHDDFQPSGATMERNKNKIMLELLRTLHLFVTECAEKDAREKVIFENVNIASFLCVYFKKTKFF